MTATATGMDRREYQRRVETLLGEIEARVGELHRLKVSGVRGRALRERKGELSRTRGRLATLVGADRS